MVGRLATRAAAALSALSFSIVVATSTSAAAAPANVTISSTQCAGGKLFCYKPPSLTIADGSGVKWTDATSVQHTVTRCTTAACGNPGPGSDTDSTFTTATIAPNGTFTHTFHGTGTYNYYCAIHGFAAMHGSITVQAPK